MLDFADFVAINKFDRKGAADALRDVRKQYQRNRELFTQAPDTMPVFGTIAARFNDDGVTALYQALAARLAETGLKLAPGKLPRVETRASTAQNVIVPPARVALPRRDRRDRARLSPLGGRAGGHRARAPAAARDADDARHRRRRDAADPTTAIDALIDERDSALAPRAKKLLDMWPQTKAAYAGDEYVVKIRGKEIRTGADHDLAVRHAHPEGRAAALRGRRRDPALAAARERAGQLPVHRRRVRVQARERGPDAHVRRRGRRVPHQPALPPARRRHAGEAAVDRVRLGDALRQRSGDRVPTSTARSATPACRSPRSTT